MFCDTTVPERTCQCVLQVVTIRKTAVGIGGQCDQPKCTWDSVAFMQNDYTLGHRQLMLDCLQVKILSRHSSKPK